MKFSKNNSLKIILIGAGGTGGYIAPHLYRIAYASGRKVQIIIADGDIVEKKNLIRQNFADCDIGKNKAQVLAERYAGAFGIKANYIPDFIESKFMLEELTSSAAFNGPQTILIGAVDNNRSRQMCHLMTVKRNSCCATVFTTYKIKKLSVFIYEINFDAHLTFAFTHQTFRTFFTPK